MKLWITLKLLTLNYICIPNTDILNLIYAALVAVSVERKSLEECFEVNWQKYKFSLEFAFREEGD